MKEKPKVSAQKAVGQGRLAAHAVSEDAKVAAHPMHNPADMNAKNETKTPTLSMHKNAGTESHKIVYFVRFCSGIFVHGQGGCLCFIFCIHISRIMHGMGGDLCIF